MKQSINKYIFKIVRLSNKQLNKKTIKNKVFCIGLHKTGTTTLADYVSNFGFNTTHSTDWNNDNSKLEKFDFFSDGGSHFDNINEFEFERLFLKYEHSKFILQTRDTEKWVISKLKHAGWNQNTEIQKDDLSKIIHDEWRYKSLLTIEKFIKHKINYEKKVISFFKENKPNRLLIIDITDRNKQHQELEKLKNYLNLKSINEITLPHSNKRISNITIPTNIQKFIRQTISTYKNV